MTINANQIKQDQAQYSMGYSDSFVNLLKSRTVKTHAQFLIPYLKADLKILDCGCGPGSMTLGFAKYAKNGEVTGVDIEDSQLAIARADAEKAEVKNVTFIHASVFELPFADNTFDLVFSQALLSHLKDPLVALLEQKRVVKPGGIVAARNGYSSGRVFYPENKLLEEAMQFHMQPAKDNGGDYDLGIKLGELFRAAGFDAIKHTVTCDTRDMQKWAAFFAEEVIKRDYSQKMLAQGKITLAKLQAYQQAYLKFANEPHTFSYHPWGEGIGTK